MQLGKSGPGLHACLGCSLPAARTAAPKGWARKSLWKEEKGC